MVLDGPPLPVLVLLAASLWIAAAAAACGAEVRSGTAFFVSASRLLTSAHGVTGCRGLTVWRPHAAGIPAQLLGVDRRLDVALLGLARPVPHTAIPAGITLPRVHERVSMIAYGTHSAAPRDAKLIGGIVVGKGRGANRQLVTVIHADTQAGTSGAPVIDGTGALVGLVIGRYTNSPQLAVAVQAQDLSRFLASHGLRMLPPSSKRHIWRSNAQLLSAMSALVQCVPLRIGHTTQYHDTGAYARHWVEQHAADVPKR